MMTFDEQVHNQIEGARGHAKLREGVGGRWGGGVDN